VRRRDQEQRLRRSRGYLFQDSMTCNNLTKEGILLVGRGIEEKIGGQQRDQQEDVDCIEGHDVGLLGRRLA
jgi:hypothetical protein